MLKTATNSNGSVFPQVAVIKVARARTGPKFEDEPVCTEAEVRRALLPAYELLGYDEEDLDLYNGLPFLFLPIQLSFVPTVGCKVCTTAKRSGSGRFKLANWRAAFELWHALCR